MIHHTLFHSVASVLVAIGVAQGANRPQDYSLFASDGAGADRFGSAVGVSNGMAVVGAYQDDDNGDNTGAAYLFNSLTGQQMAKLLPADAAAGDRVGQAVAIDGSRVLVGSPWDDDSGSLSGSVYLYDTQTGMELEKLTPHDGDAGDFFGSALGIAGDIAVIGAKGDDDHGTSAGAAYLFEVSTGQQLFKLYADDASTSDQFGDSVAVTQGTAIVGAEKDDSGPNSGAAYLFDTATGAQRYKLTADDAVAGAYFGYSVGVSGNVAIVGAINDRPNGGASGSAYLFDVNTGEQIVKLVPEDSRAGQYFGVSVAISGDFAIVGAYGDQEEGRFAGAAYLFDVPSGQQIAKLTADDLLAEQAFGWRVGIDSRQVIVGAHGTDMNTTFAGAAYVYNVPEPATSSCLLLSAFLILLNRGEFKRGA
ncbi:FG-GAP repeat protein [Botrimarina mediterranea]|uniref:FG-GAP repeat protein n=1 Tax=Botrimarina mediterranea TaxID=2528022 RepID=UPI00118BA519|nr:hypothetical protein K2D_42050 [Planctomycetes bacterium K2D]